MREAVNIQPTSLDAEELVYIKAHIPRWLPPEAPTEPPRTDTWNAAHVDDAHPPSLEAVSVPPAEDNLREERSEEIRDLGYDAHDDPVVVSRVIATTCNARKSRSSVGSRSVACFAHSVLSSANSEIAQAGSDPSTETVSTTHPSEGEHLELSDDESFVVANTVENSLLEEEIFDDDDMPVITARKRPRSSASSRDWLSSEGCPPFFMAMLAQGI